MVFIVTSDVWEFKSPFIIYSKYPQVVGSNSDDDGTFKNENNY